ncbi:MAG TPA: NAD-dependent epimerase/dehydratase family protein, partial [Chthoniobacterales bacterium]|nr:NAD-dependent epimerase/dehydratase family protein [Chthoniobacterales bacterium]
GADLTLVDSLIPDYGGNHFNIEGLEDRVHVNISDVRDTYSMRSLVQGKDYLFNLAGQTSHLDSMLNPVPDLEINCLAQLSILEACRTCNSGIKIVFASTRQIYGRPHCLPVTETHALNPVDVNGINKMAAEKYHLLYSDVYGMHATALRLTNTIGPRMRIKDARQTFVGLWIRQLLENKPIEVWGGKQLRDLTDVEDAVDAFLLAAANPATKGQVYNLGGSEVVELAGLAKLMVEVNGGGKYSVCDFPADRRAIDIGDYYADFSKIRSELGWAPKKTLRETIESTLEYYRKSISNYL